MDSNFVEAKVCKGDGNTTNLLIKTGDTVIRTAFSELAPCAFPLWTSYPIQVEIPPNGTKDFVVGPFYNCTTPKEGNCEFANTIKFPIYTSQAISSLQTYKDLPSGSTSIFSRVPVIAFGTAVSGQIGEEKRVETHCVLPVWHDNTAVLVRLDWFEGEPAEGATNPEWHMCASKGIPLNLGLKNLEQASRLPVNAKNCLYRLNISPWILGSQILGGTGKDNPHKIWQREWQFTGYDEFLEALCKIKESLIGLNTSEQPAVSGQRVY